VTGRLSLIAGSGALVPEVIATAYHRGYELQVLSLVRRRVPTGVAFVRIGLNDFESALREARQFGAPLIAMAGSVSLSDAGREQLLALAGGGESVGDTAISALSNLIEEGTGARLVGVHEIAPQLLAPDGLIAGPPPSSELTATGAFALDLARRAGRLDIGQAVVVAGRRAVALEDVAGTDALLRRVASYRRHRIAGDGRSPLVLAKAAKPDQPRAIDLPAIGPKTVVNARRAGIALIAVEAGATLLIERAGLVRAAHGARIPVVGITPDA
jgi:DUF1009 family protein